MHNFELMAFTTEYQLPLNDSIDLTLRKLTKLETMQESAHLGSWSAKVSIRAEQSSPQEFYILNSGNLISYDTCKECPSLLAIGGGYFETSLNAVERASALCDKLATTAIDKIIENSKEIAERLLRLLPVDLEHFFPEPPRDLARHLDDEPRAFFFVAYPRGERSRVTVIDVSYLCSYERFDYASIDDTNFKTAPAAIEYAKAFAKLNGLRYEPFDPRYPSDFSEV